VQGRRRGRGMVRAQELLAREPRVRATRRSPTRRRLDGHRRSRLLAGCRSRGVLQPPPPPTRARGSGSQATVYTLLLANRQEQRVLLGIKCRVEGRGPGACVGGSCDVSSCAVECVYAQVARAIVGSGGSGRSVRRIDVPRLGAAPSLRCHKSVTDVIRAPLPPVIENAPIPTPFPSENNK
jgi:hypothetical protein